MSETRFEDTELPNEQRKLIINGRRYHYATADKCTTCAAAEDRYMFVKLKIGGGDCLLECPVCDSTITVRESMINTNLNKSK